MPEPVPERPTPPDDTKGLRARLTEVATNWMRMYPFANYGFFSCADGDSLGQVHTIADSIAATWGRDIADRFLAVLVEPPGDLREQIAAALLRHGLEESSADGDRCTCGERVKDWDEHLAAVALSVRWEDAARRIAAAEARADFAEGQLSARDAHTARWETEKARADKAVAELEQYRARLAARITDEVGLSWQELLDRAERLAEPRPTFEAFRLVDGQRMAASQRAEAAEAQVAELQNERDLLRETLGETDPGAQVLAQWEAIAAADADRDRLEAELESARGRVLDLKVGVMQALGFAVVRDDGDLISVARKLRDERDALQAATTRFQAVVADIQRCQEMADPSERMRCGMCCNDHFADLTAALPSRPDDPEEIRRLAQATTESTEEPNDG